MAIKVIERIDQVRAFFGLSWEKFANKIGRTKSFISDIQSRRRNLSEKTLQQICTAFGINDVLYLNNFLWS